MLITDGDDQQSYPFEAAAVAAERHVTVFTVGLGDADHGARVPTEAESKSYIEYKGQQVWSKLDHSLLKEIALRTSGVYVPVGTRAYDLGELYASYLQNRRGSGDQGQKRIRRAEQFQVFLALALLVLLADAVVRRHPPAPRQAVQDSRTGHGSRTGRNVAPRPSVPSTTVAGLLFVAMAGAVTARADNPADAVRAGMRSYESGEFDKAREKFAAAAEQYGTEDAVRGAIAVFDEACAAHRKGDSAGARELYLKAGLAHDPRLAASAHFNLGTLAAGEANQLAGEHPEQAAPEKRPEILGKLRSAVASFRHCLELEPDHEQARRDIELVRQWIKYYSDQWQARDRQQRRQETNLVAFLEYLVKTQTSLRDTVQAQPATASSNVFAELKSLQEDLEQEIPPLREKIRSELAPPQTPGAGSPQPVQADLEQGIALLQGWAGTAGEKMASAARRLERREAAPAAAEQQAAIDELQKIWEAVIPFQALLARDLADQTSVVRSLAPAPAADSGSAAGKDSGKSDAAQQKTVPAPGRGAASLGSEAEDLAPILTLQEQTLRRTRLLGLKAEGELARLEQAKPGATRPAQPQQGGPAVTKKPGDPDGGKPPTVDPEALKKGLRKAVELAPRAAGKMLEAAGALKQKAAQAAYPPSEEARKILEEIQRAQPQQKQPPEQPKQNDDQKKQEEKEKDRSQDRKSEQDQQKQDQQKEQPGPDQKKQEQDQGKGKKQDQGQEKDPQKSQSKDAEQKQQAPQGIARDQIEQALRKVRERQQEKRERDRQMRARVFGEVPVEKDW